MGQALPITRTEHTDEALREFAAKCRDGAQVRCVLAIALILEGRPALKRRTCPAWIAKRCAIGCIATTPPGSPA